MIDALLPRTLFARTALLLATTLLLFSFIVWEAVMWAIVVPSASLTADMLAQQAQDSLAAQRDGRPLPSTTHFEQIAPSDVMRRYQGFAYGAYLRRVREALEEQLPGDVVVITRARNPTEVWIKGADTGTAWLVLSTRLARADAPRAVTLVLLLTAILVLVAAAWSARRLTQPLALLATAAADVAVGKPISIDSPGTGPREVHALAHAFESMAHRLTELNDQRELMLAGISHDLRTPLARTRVALELLDARDAELARQMSLDIEEMDRMVGQFLRYVRAGYRETPTTSCLDAVVNDALAALSNDARLQLRLAAPSPLPLAVESLRHITLNLVHNALEHGVAPVGVRTEETPHGLRLTVQDQGRGLDPQAWVEALQPFRRLRDTPGGVHSGLGLALVSRLVTALDGRLEAEQNEDGFIVRFELPV